MNKFIAICMAALCGCMAAQAITDEELLKIKEEKGYTDLWGERATMFNHQHVDSTSIVMLGNSLTQGGDWATLFNDQRFVNNGIIGDIIEGITDRLDCTVQGKPAKIFLQTGANDVSHHLTADSIARAASELVSKIKARTPYTKIYVQSMLPINYKTYPRYKNMKDKEQVVRDVNRLLKPLVEAQGATWINLYPAFCDQEGNLRADWTTDGLHLQEPGYLKWREIIAPYVYDSACTCHH